MATICSTLSGKVALKHPTLGVLVREDGTVFNKSTGNHPLYRWVKGSNSYGYRLIQIDKKHYLVHRLVAETFIENIENKPTVDHINRDRSDNRVENLRWATFKEQADNTSSVINRIDYGFRSCDDRASYDRMRRRARRKEDPDKYSTYQKEYRLSKKSMGMIVHRCLDGHRR